jgi:Tfp pilus assembly protein PilX
MTYRPKAAASRQRGVVLFVSLIMLVALTMAGLAVMRGVSAGVQITRNVVFKQGATASADRGIEAARKWLIDNKSGATLNNDGGANGYFSSYVTPPSTVDSFNAITYDWTGSNKSVTLAADAAGNVVRYVIHRLCQTPNVAVDASGQQCVAKSGTAGGGGGQSKGDLLAGGQNLDGKITPYYRVTARAEGPMSTVSYVQAMID